MNCAHEQLYADDALNLLPLSFFVLCNASKRLGLSSELSVHHSETVRTVATCSTVHVRVVYTARRAAWPNKLPHGVAASIAAISAHLLDMKTKIVTSTAGQYKCVTAMVQCTGLSHSVIVANATATAKDNASQFVFNDTIR
jgi:hypothetical protein